MQVDDIFYQKTKVFLAYADMINSRVIKPAKKRKEH